MDRIEAIKETLLFCAGRGIVLPPPDCREVAEVIQALETEVEELKREIAEKRCAAEKSVIGQVDNAIKVYRLEMDASPAVIIANVPAWDAMEKEAQRIAKPAPVNYATFRGIRVYKAADGYEKPRIRLARDVKSYDIEGGE